MALHVDGKLWQFSKAVKWWWLVYAPFRVRMGSRGWALARRYVRACSPCKESIVLDGPSALRSPEAIQVLRAIPTCLVTCHVTQILTCCTTGHSFSRVGGFYKNRSRTRKQRLSEMWTSRCSLVTSPARLPARNGLVNEVEFLRLIPQNGKRPMRLRDR